MTESTTTDMSAHFPAGIPGFDGFRDATLRPLDDEDVQGIYAQLTSQVEADFEVSFLLASPGAFFEDYTFELDDAAVPAGWGGDVNPDVWVVLTQTPGGFAANLRAPILIDPDSGHAVQAVLDERYPLARSLA